MNWLGKPVWLLALSFTLVVVLMEFVARYYGLPQPYSALYQYDSILGYQFQHDENVIVREGDKLYSIAFDEDRIVDRAGENIDIIILGDGVTAGIELTPTDRLAHKLYHLLGEKQGVLNLSVTGYGTIQESLLLEAWLDNKGVRPKDVFLVFNLSNDIIDNVQEWESTAVPGIRIADSSNQVHPPVLPSLIYRAIREFYIHSRLLGLVVSAMRPGVKQTKPDMPDHLSELFESNMSQDFVKAMIGLKLGLNKLEELKKKYGFRIHGVIWVDWGELKQIDIAQLKKGISRITALNRSITWCYFPERPTNQKAFTEWDKNHLVSGARHVNSMVINKLALTMEQKMRRYSLQDIK